MLSVRGAAMARSFPLCALLLLLCCRCCLSEDDDSMLARGKEALCRVSHSRQRRTQTGSFLKGAKPVANAADWNFNALVIVDVRLCSGAVLSADHVLTNGYCTHMVGRTDGTVFVGGLKYMTPEDLQASSVQIRAIADVFRYDGSNRRLDHDIAIVKVHDSFRLNNHVGRASLITTDRVDWPIHCTMMGFGETFEGDFAHVLSAANVTLTESGHCCDRVKTYKLGANAACALETDNAMCWGDMGGPVVDENGELVALVAYKTPKKPTLMQCGQPVKNAFFMFLGYYRDWALSVIGE